MSVARRVLPLVVLAAIACEKKSEAPPAPPLAGLPPLAENAPEAKGEKPRAEHPPTGMGAMPAGHPPIGDPHAAPNPQADPHGGMATPGDIAFDPKTVISGVMKLDDKLKAKVAAGDTIYLVAKAADDKGAPQGPALAVKKLTVDKWPLAFQLDARDAMMAGTKLAGKVVVSARVDKDGDALTKNPGDVTGATKPVVPPVEKLVLTLDTVL